MDRKQFNLWWTDYARKFPSTARWLNEFSDEGRQSLLDTWASVLSDVPLRAAMQVSSAMAHDRIEPVGSYDHQRERTAVIVRRAALDRASKDQPAKPLPQRPLYRRTTEKRSKRDEQPMTALLEQVWRLMESGRTAEEAAREAQGDDATFEPSMFDAYSCTLCRDTGTVEVWRAEAMRAYREDPQLLDDNPRLCKPVLTPCACSEGDRYIWREAEAPPRRWSGWRHDSSRYDPHRFCFYSGGDAAAELAYFKRWAEWFFSRRLTGEAEPPERH